MVATASTFATPHAWNLDVAWSIPNGTPVHDCAGVRIGAVCDAEIDALIVARGRFFIHEYAVAMTDVDRMEQGRLVLRVTKDAVLNSGRT